MPIHTIQLVTPPLSHMHFQKSLSRAYELVQQKKCRIVQNDPILIKVDGSKGIKVGFIDDMIPYLSFQINPSVMLGGGYSDLCRITLENFERCAAIIDSVLDLLKIDLTCSQLILSRIDCTVDIAFPYENGIVDFLGCVRRTKLTGRYKATQFPPEFENYEEGNLHSFRITCGDVWLTAYDKSYQLLEEGLMNPAEIPSDRLRLEAAFMNGAFQRLFSRYSRCTIFDTLGKRIVWFSDMSVRLVREYFEKR